MRKIPDVASLTGNDPFLTSLTGNDPLLTSLRGNDALIIQVFGDTRLERKIKVPLSYLSTFRTLFLN